MPEARTLGSIFSKIFWRSALYVDYIYSLPGSVPFDPSLLLLLLEPLDVRLPRQQGIVLFTPLSGPLKGQ
jgi:hypothetical protein